MAIYKTAYSLGDLVYLKTDTDQKSRLIVEIDICKAGIYYGLSCGTEYSRHFDFEMSITKDILKMTESN